jgi:integrase/recombinase XerC/integrase/recombinase XerD
VEQVNTLLNSIDRTTIRGKRDYAMINLMLRTALRTIEVIRLTVEDMVMEGGIIMLYVLRKGSQGNKTKIQLTHKAFDPINDYLVDRKNLKDDQPLFTGLSYNNRNGQMGQKSLSAIIRQRLQNAGIHDSRITAHSMRHTAAVNALKAGASLHDLQLFMGHTDPSTTQIYVRILEEEKRLANGPGKLLDNVY